MDWQYQYIDWRRGDQRVLDLLKQGSEVWNSWREKNSVGMIYLGSLFDSEEENQPRNLENYNLEGVDFSRSYLRGCSFRGANLHQSSLRWAELGRADFSGADLSESAFRETKLEGAKFRSVNLSRARLLDVDLSGLDISDSDLRDCVLSELKGGRSPSSKAKLERCNLERSNLSGANLEGVVLVKSKLVSAILVKTNLIETNQDEVDLTNADLTEADLCRASLIRADLTSANFFSANLTGANLSRCQALGANFTKANLTGACIDEVDLTNADKLDNVVCEYVYQKFPDQERLPSDPNQNFASGEFTKLFQKALSTVNLVFQNGIDWDALLISFDKLRIEAEGAELSIQAIENKDDGAFVVRVNVPPEADKAEVEKFLKREYEAELKIIDEKYRSQLSAKDVEIEGYRRENANIMEIARLMATRPINIEAKAIAESQTMGDRNIHTDGGNYNESISGNYIQGNYINLSQDLVQAAAQIQDLITQLQTQGATTETIQQQVATDLANAAKANPTMMDKLAGWGETLTQEVSKKTIGDVVSGTVKLALRAAGLPLP